MIWSFLVESPLKQNLLKMVGMKKKLENKNQSKAVKKKRNLTHKEWHQAWGKRKIEVIFWSIMFESYFVYKVFIFIMILELTWVY